MTDQPIGIIGNSVPAEEAVLTIQRDAFGKVITQNRFSRIPCPMERFPALKLKFKNNRQRSDE